MCQLFRIDPEFRLLGSSPQPQLTIKNWLWNRTRETSRDDLQEQWGQGRYSGTNSLYPVPEGHQRWAQGWLYHSWCWLQTLTAFKHSKVTSNSLDLFGAPKLCWAYLPTMIQYIAIFRVSQSFVPFSILINLFALSKCPLIHYSLPGIAVWLLNMWYQMPHKQQDYYIKIVN